MQFFFSFSFFSCSSAQALNTFKHILRRLEVVKIPGGNHSDIFDRQGSVEGCSEFSELEDDC